MHNIFIKVGAQIYHPSRQKGKLFLLTFAMVNDFSMKIQ